VENIIYHGAEATCARIHLDSGPGPTALDLIRTGNPHIISVDLTEIDHHRHQSAPRTLQEKASNV